MQLVRAAFVLSLAATGSGHVYGHSSLDEVSDVASEVEALDAIGLSAFEPELGRDQRHVCTAPEAKGDAAALQQRLAGRRAAGLARGRVAILMVAMGTCLADYGHHTVAINLAYAEKHGYDMVVHDGYPGEKSHPAWQKLRVIEDLMSEGSGLLASLSAAAPYDVVMYIDADAAVTGMEIELESFLAPGDAGAIPDIVGCRDSWSVVNCGALLFRRTRWLLSLLARWYDRRAHGGAAGTHEPGHALCATMTRDAPDGADTDSLLACCANLGGTPACAARHGVDALLRCCAHYEETRYREQTVLDLMMGANERGIAAGRHFRILEPSRGECFQQTKAHEASPATLLLHLPGTTSPLRAAIFGHLRAHWCMGDALLGLPPQSGAPPSRLLGARRGRRLGSAADQRAVLLRASLASYDTSLRQLAAEPRTPRALVLLAHAHFNAGAISQHLGQLGTAAAHLDASVAALRALPPGEPAAPLALPRYIETQAVIAAALGRQDEAIDLLAAAVDEFDDASLRAVLGSELLQRAPDDAAWAQALLRAARREMPRHAGVAANLGIALVYGARQSLAKGRIPLGELAAVEAALKEAIELMEEGAVTNPQAIGGNLAAAREDLSRVVAARQTAARAPGAAPSADAARPPPRAPPPSPSSPPPSPPSPSPSAPRRTNTKQVGRRAAADAGAPAADQAADASINAPAASSAVPSIQAKVQAARERAARAAAEAAEAAAAVEDAEAEAAAAEQAAAETDAGEVAKAAAEGSAPSVGFFLQSFRQDRATLEVVRSVRRCYPAAPIYLVSDAGHDFGPMCADAAQRCRFEWSAHATRQKGGWAAGGWDEWSRRLLAALDYAEAEYATPEGGSGCGASRGEIVGAGRGVCAAGPTHLVLLEDDVRCERPIAEWPITDGAGVDDRAGRLTNPFTQAALDYFARHGGREHAYEHYGLAGGTIIRAAALRDALSPPTLDVEVMRALDTRIGYFNDVTIAAALLAKGYTVGPWAELTEVGAPPPPPVRAAGGSAAPHAFTHNVKDWYGVPLEPHDAHLVRRDLSAERRCAAIAALRAAIARQPHDALSLAQLGRHYLEGADALSDCAAARGALGCSRGGRPTRRAHHAHDTVTSSWGARLAAEAYACSVAELPIHFMVAETPQFGRAKMVAELLSNLAAAEAQLGNMSAARHALHRAHAADPSNAAVKQNMRRLADMRDMSGG